MLPGPEQRRLLGAFLRSHRERLSPADAGLSGGSVRRRTPGLRREEVAFLCGLSATWYTWLEQGREVSMSPEALARVAVALRLSPAERAYLFELARKRDPDGRPGEGAGAPPPALEAALRAVTAPAYLLDGLWHACAWNAPAERLFSGWLGGPERNLLRYVFLDPGARDFICDWPDRARRLVAEFRAATARRTEDAAVRDLVNGLGEASDAFTRFWNDHGVLDREGGRRAFRHPADGPLVYEQVTLLPVGHGGHTMAMLLGPVTPGSPSPD
ncbi:helix-turn-helix transcriptional regulator [Azospirillum sp. ST 5-10]|uniref:helix-turn-helix transcriptional regulator n=1 Tax=unclassified Azospirillum TaxID=2630922 RepID=UPI003F49DBE6